MTRPLRIAITADLHWGHRQGNEATLALVAWLRNNPPDLFVLAGDIGTGVHFEECLRLFSFLNCPRTLVPGNHDLWVGIEAPYDSLEMYERRLPEASALQGFIYLDHGPLILPDSDLALVGSINWYDYSWSIDQIRKHFPGEEHRLTTKRFTRGRHNDANFVRWPLNDSLFTTQVINTLTKHLESALAQVSRVIIITHHPSYSEISFARPWLFATLDSLLWQAFAGNVGVEQLLAKHAHRIAFAFCGHTHRARENTWLGIRGYNVGSDYPFKRLLILDWPTGRVESHSFHSAAS